MFSERTMKNIEMLNMIIFAILIVILSISFIATHVYLYRTNCQCKTRIYACENLEAIIHKDRCIMISRKMAKYVYKMEQIVEKLDAMILAKPIIYKKSIIEEVKYLRMEYSITRANYMTARVELIASRAACIAYMNTHA